MQPSQPPNFNLKVWLDLLHACMQEKRPVCMSVLICACLCLLVCVGSKTPRKLCVCVGACVSVCESIFLMHMQSVPMYMYVYMYMCLRLRVCFYMCVALSLLC